MTLYLHNGKLLIRTVGGVTGLATSAACCCGAGTGCFTCITADAWEVNIITSLTGCLADIDGDWGWFTVTTHPSEPDWCRASGTLPAACGYPVLGFYWDWEADGTIRLTIFDLSTSAVLSVLTGTATTCYEVETGVDLTGADGTATTMIRVL